MGENLLLMIERLFKICILTSAKSIIHSGVQLVPFEGMETNNTLHKKKVFH